MNNDFYVIEFSKDNCNKWPVIFDWVIKKSSIVEFVVSKEHPLVKDYKQCNLPSFAEIKNIQPNLLEYKIKNGWFFKKKIIKVNLTEEIIGIIKRVNFLNEWMYTGLNNLSFYSENKLMMKTITHDGFGLIFIKELNNDDKKFFNDLGFSLNDKAEI